MVLGVMVGVLAGVVVLLFRLAIAEATEWFTLGQGFAGLSPWARLLLPAAGGLAVGLLATFAFPRHADVGVRLANCFVDHRTVEAKAIGRMDAAEKDDGDICAPPPM